MRSLKRTIENERWRAREGDSIRKRNYTTRQQKNQNLQLQMPREFFLTDNGEEFLLYDSGTEHDRSLIFCTRKNLNILKLPNNWYLDSSFHPILFSSDPLYPHVICGLNNSNIIPVVFALLPDKTEESYDRLFACLKREESKLVPKLIMTDFNNAANNAISVEFPNAQHAGCFYHFLKLIYRKIEKGGLKIQYENDPELATKMRMLPALAFVPKHHIRGALDQLMDNIQYPVETQPIMDYFEDTWIGRPDRRGQRRAPKYDYDLWSVYDSVRAGLFEMHYNCEQWHSGFYESLGNDHTTIWKLLTVLKQEQNKTEMLVDQYVMDDWTQEDRKYQDWDIQIQSILQKYDQIGLLEYLNSLAHTFDFV